MRNHIELLFMHGWGFDASCWQYWTAAISELAERSLYDRGYFGAPDRLEDLTSMGRNRVVVTHSLGAHFLTPEMLDTANSLVVIAGFHQFHQSFDDQRKSRAITSAMRRKLIRSPLSVLSDFYKRCGYLPVFIADSSMFNIDLLAADLDLLDEHSLDLTRLAHIPNKLILHGGADDVSPVSNSQLLHDALPGSVLKVLPQAGHALPFTHPQWCLNCVEELMPVRAKISTIA